MKANSNLIWIWCPVAGCHYIILPPPGAGSENVIFLSRPCEDDLPAFVLGDRVCEFEHPLLCPVKNEHLPRLLQGEKGGREGPASWQHLFSHCLVVYIGLYHANPLPHTQNLTLPLVQQRTTTAANSIWGAGTAEGRNCGVWSLGVLSTQTLKTSCDLPERTHEQHPS